LSVECGVYGVHEAVVDLLGGAAEHGEDGDGDAEADDGVCSLEAGPHAEGTGRDSQ
jgi:hypothetical protein